MKRASIAILCASFLLLLCGCAFIWQGIIGKGYYQLTQASIQNKSASMSGAPIDLTALTTSSVIVYKTSANGLYGKLSLLTAPPTANLLIMFETYALDGTSKTSSQSVTITPNEGFDLEAGTQQSPSISDFQFTASPPTLNPKNSALFYLVP